MRRALEKVETQKAEVMAKLEEFKQEEDVTTGHAFVTFMYERDRNKLISMCSMRNTTMVAAALRWCHFSCCAALLGDKRPVWESAASRGGKPRSVVVAPEPDDVKWENLQLDEWYERKQVGGARCECHLCHACPCATGDGWGWTDDLAHAIMMVDRCLAHAIRALADDQDLAGDRLTCDARDDWCHRHQGRPGADRSGLRAGLCC